MINKFISLCVNSNKSIVNAYFMCYKKEKFIQIVRTIISNIITLKLGLINIKKHGESLIIKILLTIHHVLSEEDIFARFLFC